MAPCLSNVSGCFLSSSLPDTPLLPNYSFWVWVRSPLPPWHYGFITPLCIACLPACLPACLLGLSMNLPCCDVYLFPGGHSLCEQVDRTWSASSAFPRHTYPVEQDALVTPNRSGSLPTAHIWVLRMAWQKMSSQLFFFFFLSEVD